MTGLDRSVVFFALVALVAPAAVAVADDTVAPGDADATREWLETPFDRRVFTGKELREAGVTRLSDILYLAEDWDMTTLDGFTWDASVRGLAPYETQTWIVLVDGVRVDMNQLGTSSLNRLPLGIGQIERVELVNAPQMQDGQFSASGMIHFFTTDPDEGAALGARAALGNETGDPGPYRYTPYATPNNDKQGPDVAGELSYATADAFVEAGATKLRHYATDVAQRERTFRIAVPGDYPQLNVYTTFLRAGLDGLGGAHRLYAGYSYFEDYFYLSALGREVPALSRMAHAALTGLFGREEGANVVYRAEYTYNALDERANTLGIDFDFATGVLRADIEAGYVVPSFGGRVGVGIVNRSAQSGYALSDDNDVAPRAYVEIDHALTSAGRQELGLVVANAGDDVALDASLRQSWNVGESNRLAFGLGFVHRPAQEDPRVWLWNERGYRIVEDNGVAVTRVDSLSSTDKLTADIALTRSLGDNIYGRVGAYYRNFMDTYIEAQSFQYDSLSHAFGSPVTLEGDYDGQVAGAEVVVEGEIGDVYTRTYYRYQSAIAGDALFEAQWARIPEHHFRQTVTYRPVAAFSMRAVLGYYSATEWRDYADVAAQTGGEYTSTIDDFFTFELGAQKWFWHEQFRAAVFFRDIFSQAPNYHPIGAAFDLTVFIQFEIAFRSR